MLFFFGTRTSRVATAPLPGVTCAYCGTPNALSCTVFSRYFHFFWIPAFPIGKISVTECQHCKQALTLREMPAAYRAPVQALESQTKPPLTHFALLLLFGALLAFGLVVGVVDRFTGHTTAAGAAATTEKGAAPAGQILEEDEDGPPAVGAQYTTKLLDGSRTYCLAQVTSVTPDTVCVRMTGALRGPLSAASAVVALRDSVGPTDTRRAFSTTQWHYSTTGEGLFRRLAY